PSLSVPLETLPAMIRPAGASLAVWVPARLIPRPAHRTLAPLAEPTASRSVLGAPDRAALEPAPAFTPRPPASPRDVPALAPPAPPLPTHGRALPLSLPLSLPLALAFALGIAALLALGHLVASLVTHARAASARRIGDPRLLESLERARDAVGCVAPISLRTS